jgi:hypothetical protein
MPILEVLCTRSTQATFFLFTGKTVYTLGSMEWKTCVRRCVRIGFSLYPVVLTSW